LPGDRDNLGLSKYRQPAASTFLDDFQWRDVVHGRRNDSSEHCGRRGADRVGHLSSAAPPAADANASP
jgi:hypothetical protein